MATRNSTPHNYKDGSVVSPIPPQRTRLTPQQLKEKRVKRLCYNCDNKYIKGHKCAEKKLFTLIVKRRKKRIKKHQKKRMYTRNQPQRKKK